MILCLNLNAAVDKTVVVSPFRLNEIHRPEQVLALPGGKGANVARGLKHLGGAPVVMGWVGGFNGGFIESGLQREGIATAFVHVAAESRTCLSIVDNANGTLTEIYERGDAVPEAKIAELEERFRTSVGQYQVVTLSGSLPPGVPADFYARLIAIAHAAGVPVYLDSSGAALRQGLAHGQVFLIKPNRYEFADLIGAEPADPRGLAAAAQVLARQWATIVVLSLGGDGALVASRDLLFRVQPPPIRAQSAVGSGDCLLAGLVYTMSNGGSLAEAARYGVAAGTANALTLGAGRFSRADFTRILADVTITEMEQS
jgi:tagatose 6-phosphate kinase